MLVFLFVAAVAGSVAGSVAAPTPPAPAAPAAAAAAAAAATLPYQIHSAGYVNMMTGNTEAWLASALTSC